MRDKLQLLEEKARELRRELVLIGHRERSGAPLARDRVRAATKLRHVERAIEMLKQGRLF